MLDRYLTKATLKHRTLLTLYSAVVYGNTSPELTSLKYVNVSPTNPSGRTHGEVTRGRWAGSPIFKLHVELLVFKLTEKLDFKLCSNFSAICVEDFFFVAIFASRLFTCKTFVLRRSSTRYFKGRVNQI